MIIVTLAAVVLKVVAACALLWTTDRAVAIALGRGRYANLDWDPSHRLGSFLLDTLAYVCILPAAACSGIDFYGWPIAATAFALGSACLLASILMRVHTDQSDTT